MALISKIRVNQDQQDLRGQQGFLASRESQETPVDLAIRGQWGNRDLRGWTGSRESEEARALLEDQDPQDLRVLPVTEDYQDFLDLQDLPVSAANGELRTLQLTVDFKPQNTFLGVVPRDSGINSHRGHSTRYCVHITLVSRLPSICPALQRKARNKPISLVILYVICKSSTRYCVHITLVSRLPSICPALQRKARNKPISLVILYVICMLQLYQDHSVVSGSTWYCVHITLRKARNKPISLVILYVICKSVFCMLQLYRYHSVVSGSTRYCVHITLVSRLPSI
ncbi:hypothetical protein J6590_091154 [Homalodisca vitripennis]|nr:hypothetical protein J6590_091154 [Homalodisca vitripennis]